MLVHGALNCAVFGFTAAHARGSPSVKTVLSASHGQRAGSVSGPAADPGGVLQVVTDPQKADAIFTDGSARASRKPQRAVRLRPTRDKRTRATRRGRFPIPPCGRFPASRGVVFLVDRKTATSSGALTSSPRAPSPRILNHVAAEDREPAGEKVSKGEVDASDAPAAHSPRLPLDNTPPAAPSSPAYRACDHFGPRALGHRFGFLRIAQASRLMSREFGRIIGQRADLAVVVRQSFRAQARRNHRDPRRERLQQFHPHAGARQNRADEHASSASAARAHLPRIRSARSPRDPAANAAAADRSPRSPAAPAARLCGSAERLPARTIAALP